MTNRENPVWQMAYAVEFAHQLRDHLRLYIWPDDALLVELGDEAKTVADAAVEALGEQQPQPATPQQSRDNVPYSQLEADRSDSELLDAILKAYEVSNVTGVVRDACERAIAERANR